MGQQYTVKDVRRALSRLERVAHEARVLPRGKTLVVEPGSQTYGRPDADATDVFPVTNTEIDAILSAFDNVSRDEAIEEAGELGLTLDQASDLLEWFNRA